MFKTFCGRVSTSLSSLSRYIPSLPCKLSTEVPASGNLRKKVSVHVASTNRDTQKNLHCGSGSSTTRPIRIPRTPRTIPMTRAQAWVMYGSVVFAVLCAIYTIPTSIRIRQVQAELNQCLEDMEKEEEERKKKSLSAWYSLWTCLLNRTHRYLLYTCTSGHRKK